MWKYSTAICAAKFANFNYHPKSFLFRAPMTIRDFFILNTPDTDGKVPVLIFRDEYSGADESLYLCLSDDEQWRLFDAKQSEWTDTQSHRDLFPLITDWLNENFTKQIHGSDLDPSECYNEIFGQIQSTGSPVDLKYSSLISVLRNTQWEREQEGLPTEAIYTDHTTLIRPTKTDVLIVSDSLKFEKLSNALWSQNYTTQEVHSLREAIDFCEKNIPSAILIDTTKPMSIESSNLHRLAEFSSKLVSIIDTNDPHEELIAELSDDTYIGPVNDQSILNCLHRYLGTLDHSPYRSVAPSSENITLDVLLVYNPEASKSIQETFKTHRITSSVLISIPDAITFCIHTTPTIILLDAKNLTETHIASLRTLQETKNTRTRLYSCLTESSPYQNEIMGLSDQIFIVPVRTSEIMKHVLTEI